MMPLPQPLRVVIATGGTGGHVYPGIAVARALESLVPTEVLFIGTAERMEARLVPREGFAFATIRVRGFERSLRPAPLFRNLCNLGRLALGLPLWQARRHLREFQPEVVVGIGGYVSGPVVLAARLAGIPTALVEPNALPGLTNRLLAPLVGYVAAAWPETLTHLRRTKTSEVTGNPLRPGFLTDAETVPAVLREFAPERPLLLVVGGSLGAGRLNRAVEGLVESTLAAGSPLAGLQVLHVLGERFHAPSPLEGQSGGRYRRVPYLHEMAAAMRRATVILSRAGAGLLAEITAVGLPAILVPWPGAAENHQERNARALEAAGAGRMLLDADCTSDNLARVLGEVLAPEVLAELRERCRALGRPEAALTIARRLRQLAGRDK
jgi:UDP-N-acetylglucosamine--N-acetylmuramyl-(pentapeptide) pyrophosphoryl-undecaprenol N-acetylglucosamine transferase